MKPGKKLTDPSLKAVTDKIYKRDPKRYQRLIHWVWFNQKAGWSNGAIREALSMADEYLDQAPEWWAYLQKVLPKGAGRASEKVSDEHKRADMAIATEFVEFLKSRGTATPKS